MYLSRIVRSVFGLKCLTNQTHSLIISETSVVMEVNCFHIIVSKINVFKGMTDF
jgi:hypothetical protein